MGSSSEIDPCQWHTPNIFDADLIYWVAGGEWGCPKIILDTNITNNKNVLLAMASTCARDRCALQQLALNLHIKHMVMDFNSFFN